MRVRTLLTALAACYPLLAGASGRDAAVNQVPLEAAGAYRTLEREWSVHVDNDLFALRNRDRDFTAGVSFSMTGEAAKYRAPRFAAALDWLDTRLAAGPLRTKGSEDGRSLETGLLLFTPQDLSASEPQLDDRPYASLLYVTTSKLELDAAERVARQSSLTLGALGLPLAEQVHAGVHRAFGSEQPMGYDHQISDGGELTFRYVVERQQLLASGTFGGHPFDLRFGTEASVGYLTEANAEIAARWGRTPLPWWSSLPGASDYAGQPPMRGTAGARGHGVDVVLDMGAKLRLRAYNAFLQGQFRDSDVAYSSSDLNHWLLEGWLGVTAVVNDRWSVSYTIRRQTEELDVGRGERGFTWATISVAHRLP